MIELSPDTFCMLYLGLAISIILFFWYKNSTRKKEIIRFEKTTRKCQYCHHEYIEDKKEAVSRCPNCHLFQ